MNKHSIITIVAIIVIILPFAHSGFSIIGMQNLEYRWDSPGQFSFFTMSNNGEISYAPDPLLLLMQLITTDSLAIGIKPKYSNEIRYYFNNQFYY